MIRPLTRLQHEVVGTGDSAPIDCYLGAQHHGWHLRYPGVPTGSSLADIDIALIDTGNHPEIPAGEAALWHLLWVRDEPGAMVTVRGTDQQSWPIAPGDTVPVPGGSTLATAGGQLGLLIRVPGADVGGAPPTHGSDRFFGHNRRTVAATLGAVRLCRWKLTQPLALTEHYEGPVLLIAIARTAVVRTKGTIDLLRQGELAAIARSAEPVVAPDGLAYLLTIDRPRCV